MRKLVFGSTMAVAAVLLFAILPCSVSGQEGIVAAYNGKTTVVPSCQGDDCVGDLVTCPEGIWRVPTQMTFTYIENVCDDTDPTSACAGRLTTLHETCARPWIINGMLASSQRELGKTRICFDEDAVSDCTDPLSANVVVVYEADIRVDSRFMWVPFQVTPSGNLMRSEYQGNTEYTPTATTPFTIDGKTVELPSIVTVAHWTLQNDPDGDDCEAINALLGRPAGCGIAGVIIAPQTPTAACCCADCDGNGEVKVNELITGVNNSLQGCPQQ